MQVANFCGMVQPILLRVWAVANHKSLWLVEGSVLEVRACFNWSGIEGNRFSETSTLACWSWILVNFFSSHFAIHESGGKKPQCLPFSFYTDYLKVIRRTVHTKSNCARFWFIKILEFFNLSIKNIEKHVKMLTESNKMFDSVQLSTLKMGPDGLYCWQNKFISALRFHCDFPYTGE